MQYGDRTSDGDGSVETDFCLDNLKTEAKNTHGIPPETPLSILVVSLVLDLCVDACFVKCLSFHLERQPMLLVVGASAANPRPNQAE